ncbi:MAG: glycogen-binding domain-containing protein [Gemmatimonadota bacterium]|jgi:hypothetical protein
MNDDIHRHLDGEIPADALAEEDRRAADDWDRMLASFRQASPAGNAPPWLEQKVMAEIQALPEKGPLLRLLEWLVSPAPVRVSPLAAGLVAAAVVLAVLLPRSGAAPPVPPTADAASQVVYVQFLLEAPGAMSVAVAGDFTDWEPAFTLDDADGDGVWSGRIPVRPGVHGYMFLVDGTEWMTDPNASRYQDDGFGNRNAVLAVGASG